MIIYFIRNLNGALEGNIFKGSFANTAVLYKRVSYCL